MIIDLKSIDENGKNYNFDETSDEVQGAFKDLIGSSPFKVDIDITPMGNTYNVTGTLSSQFEDVCSLCAYDIDVPLQGKINEIIVIEKERPRNTQVSQSQQDFDSTGPSVTYINDSQLDLSELLHDLMAASMNQYPVCADKELCEQQRFKQEVDVEDEVKVGHPGFEALKTLKINKH